VIVELLSYIDSCSAVLGLADAACYVDPCHMWLWHFNRNRGWLRVPVFILYVYLFDVVSLMRAPVF
jgi:hypothetical protein